MRRPVMYFAGLLLATGASLALAGPAAAAGSNSECNHPNHAYSQWDDDADTVYYHSSEWNKNSNNRQFGLINGGIGDKTGNGGLIGLGGLL